MSVVVISGKKSRIGVKGKTIMEKIRERIYKASAVIRDDGNGTVIEIFGKLGLEDRFYLWDEYGRPLDSIYFSIDSGTIVDINGLNQNDLNWTIGWVSENGTVFVLVDVLNMLVHYYFIGDYQNNQIGTTIKEIILDDIVGDEE